jgi:hypothetical protein
VAFLAQSSGEFVTCLDSPTFAMFSPITVGGLCFAFYVAVLARQVGYVLKVLLVSKVAKFWNHHLINLAQMNPPTTLEANCIATISGINPPKAIVGNAKESTAAPAMFEPVARFSQG